MGRLPGRTAPFGLEPRREKALDRAALKHFWHPDRHGVEHAPKHVQDEIAKIHPDLRVCKAPGNAPMDYRPWVVWYRNPDVKHVLCPGWSLVFAWEHPETKEPLPLDNRLYANIYMVDGRRFKSAVAYFDGCVTELKRDRQKAKEKSQQLTREMSNDVRDYRKIKNIGKGNKYALHHDGTTVPSLGEFLWRQQTLYDRLPGSVEREANERDGKNTRKRASNSHEAGSAASHAEANRDFQRQIDMLKFMKDRRELLGRRLSRKSVGVSR